MLQLSLPSRGPKRWRFLFSKVVLCVLCIIPIWALAAYLLSSQVTLTNDMDSQARETRVQLAQANELVYAPPSLSSSYEALKHTRTKSIFITAIIHNNAEFLRTTLQFVDKVGQFFKTYHVGFYENDSDDDTLKILDQWSRKHPNKSNIHILSEKLNLKGAISHGGFSKGRFDLLATYRNNYLDLIDKYAPDVDYVFIVDMDLFDTTLDGFLSSFTPQALSMQWTAVGANGLFNDNLYYDTLAFRNSTFYDTRISEQRDQAHDVYVPGSPWRPVDSMFGGMAVYKRSCMRGCRYLQDGDCEHVSMYKCMAQKKNNCDRFFINPSFVVDYHIYLPMP